MASELAPGLTIPLKLPRPGCKLCCTCSVGKCLLSCPGASLHVYSELQAALQMRLAKLLVLVAAAFRSISIPHFVRYWVARRQAAPGCCQAGWVLAPAYGCAGEHLHKSSGQAECA